MKIDRILNAVYRQPWAITEDNHGSIRETLQAYLAGAQFPSLKEDEEEPQKVGIVGRVAILDIEGTILPKASGIETSCGAFSLQKFSADLKAAAENPSISSIILNIASGGGRTRGVCEAADLIASVAKTKNVIAYTADMAASAAYWLGSQANRFYMSKGASVGSIGVFVYSVTCEEQFAKEGLKAHLFTTGDRKGAGLDGLPLTDVQKADIQSSVDKTFTQFVSYIQSKRPQVARESMQGQMFDCEDAIKAGLVDGEINSLDDLIAYLNQ